MGYPMDPNWPPPNSPAAPPPPRPRNNADVAISVVLLVTTVLVCGAGGLFSLMSLAFLDNCPPATCSVDAAVSAVMMTIAAVALFGVTGLVFTVVRLSTRKPAWPFATATLAVCVLVFFLGALGYTAAVS